MDKFEKYEAYRTDPRTGDISLWHGHSAISRTIQKCDRINKKGAYHNHAAVNIVSVPRVMILDANADGVNPHFFGSELNSYKDFNIIRIKNRTPDQIQRALDKVMDKAEEKIKYDFWALPRIALNRLFNLKIKYTLNNKDYCSEFVRRFTNELGVKCYNTGNDISPEDLVRLADPAEIEFITDFKCQN